jgi:CheY-like chemotaxis protein
MDNKGKKILIVEDDQFLREFYVELLSGEGYAIDAAADGEDGLVRIHNGGYDLVLLDIMLPKRDGVQILESLKTNPPIHSNGPIVMLTNIGQDSTIKTCFTYGATGYMIKSALEPSQVLSEVQNYLKPMTPKA